MTRVIVFNSVTLDRVMHAGGRSGEDNRGGAQARLRLVDTKTSSAGVIIATYRAV